MKFQISQVHSDVKLHNIFQIKTSFLPLLRLSSGNERGRSESLLLLPLLSHFAAAGMERRGEREQKNTDWDSWNLMSTSFNDRGMITGSFPWGLS